MCVKIITFITYPMIALILFVSSVSTNRIQAEMMNINHSSIMVMDPWIRSAPPMVKNGAAYFMLHNNSDRDVTIVDVRSPVAKMASMHDVVIENNLTKMVHLKTLTVPSGKMINFSPGGKHLMLIDLQEKLNVDRIFSVTFILESGEKIISEMKVKSGISNSHHHQH